MLASRSDLSELNPAITISSQVLSLMVSEMDLTHTKLPQIEWAMYLICIPALGCIKLSVLFFYHRIFCPQEIGLARIFIIMMMCIVVLWAVGFWFANLLACKGNFSAWWGSPVDLITKCVKTLELTYSLSITDFITDAIVLLIPLPLVRLMRTFHLPATLILTLPSFGNCDFKPLEKSPSAVCSF